MEGKDQPCICGHNRWKTIKKKKMWKCRGRGCGLVRALAALAPNPQRKLGTIK